MATGDDPSVLRAPRGVAALAVLAAVLLAAGSARAGPSAVVLVPSVETEPFGNVDLSYAGFFRAKANPGGSRSGPVSDFGMTVGLLPFDRVRAEAGFDLVDQPGDAGKYPLSFNAKVAAPEGGSWRPALAAGIYNAGTKRGDLRAGSRDGVATDQDVVYAIAAKTLPAVGRLAAGGYAGNRKALVDAEGRSAAKGVLLSWERALPEISERLRLGVEYQGGKNALGALSFGATWAVSETVGMLAGYNRYNSREAAGQDTYTVQLFLELR